MIFKNRLYMQYVPEYRKLVDPVPCICATGLSVIVWQIFGVSLRQNSMLTNRCKPRYAKTEFTDRVY